MSRTAKPSPTVQTLEPITPRRRTQGKGEIEPQSATQGTGVAGVLICSWCSFLELLVSGSLACWQTACHLKSAQWRHGSEAAICSALMHGERERERLRKISEVMALFCTFLHTGPRFAASASMCLGSQLARMRACAVERSSHPTPLDAQGRTGPPSCMVFFFKVVEDQLLEM